MMTTRTRFTAEDLLLLPDDGRRYELIDGELVELAAAGGEHGSIAANFCMHMNFFAQERDLGAVMVADTGVVVRRSPDQWRVPDVCFVARERLPGGKAPKSLLDVIPDIVVEVVSPSDKAVEVDAKIAEWLAAGVRLVWVVFPDTRSVMAYQSGASVRRYSEADTLDGGAVWPNFAVPVARFFVGV